MSKKRYYDQQTEYKKAAYFKKRNKIRSGTKPKSRSPIFSFDLGFKFFGRNDEYD